MAATWIEHQHRDDYWKQGSVCEDYAAITAAVYAVGGWADGYSNAIPRLIAGLPGPKKGLIGPWAHAYPHVAQPGPQIGFLQEALRWWDHWLKGIDTGIMDEPVLRAWMQESVRPATTYAERPGRWVAETAWPPQDRQPMLLHLSRPRAVGNAGRRWRGDHRFQPCDRRDLRRVVPLRPCRRIAVRPAPRRRALGLLRQRAAFAAPRDFRRAGGDARPRMRQAFRDDRRTAGGRRAGRLLDAGHLRPAQPDASRRPRTSAGAGARPQISRGDRAQRHRPGISGGPSHPAGAGHLALADRLAFARDGDAARLDREQHAVAAGSRAVAPRRGACGLSRHRKRRQPSRMSSPSSPDAIAPSPRTR